MLKLDKPAIKPTIEGKTSSETVKSSSKARFSNLLTGSSLHLNHQNIIQFQSKIYHRANDLIRSTKITKKFFPLTPKCSKILSEGLKYSQNIESIKYRLRKIQEIKKKYDFNISPKSQHSNYQIRKLEKQARQSFEYKRRQKAVQVIETWWKSIIINRKIREFNYKLNKKASLIQKKWRFYKAKTQLKINLKKIISSAILIQKHFRGYMSRKQFSFNLKVKSMQETFAYFQKLKQKIETQSALKIQQAWKKFKEKKKRFIKPRIQILKRKTTFLKPAGPELARSPTTSSKIPSISRKSPPSSSSTQPKTPILPQIPSNKPRPSIRPYSIKY